MAGDLEVLERFGDGISAVAMSFLALTAWQLGNVERARELIEYSHWCAAEFGHGPSMTTTNDLEVLLRNSAGRCLRCIDRGGGPRGYQPGPGE